MTVTYLIGDTREQIATIADSSVSLVACSPPFIALRSYLPADHPMKHAEIGSEPDPATFLDTLLGLTAEWGRVLAPWGSIAIELGDTYAGSGGAGGDYNADGLRDGQDKFDGSSRKGGQWPRPKCLALVPQLYAASLAYGRNLLTGEPSPAGQWLVRNMIVWHRPNPAVGALGDKFRPSTSYITVATRSPKRWFDLTAVRTAFASPDNNAANLARGGPTYGIKGPNLDRADLGAGNFYSKHAGAPPLDTWTDHHDTWTITTQPSSLAHYAMWPAKLAERLVLSMCPEWVCLDCGRPLDSKHVRTNTMPGVSGADRSSVGEVAGRAQEAQILLKDMREPSHSQESQIDDLQAVDDARVRGAVEADSPDGQQSRIRHGASVPDGRASGPQPDGERGCSPSQRDQDGQPSREPRSDGEKGPRSTAEAEAATVRLPPMWSASRQLRDTLACQACGSSNLTPGVTLDPFCGTGTTLAVAALHGRDAIGIDIDSRNKEMYEARYQEVKRSLFGTTPELPGQEALFT